MATKHEVDSLVRTLDRIADNIRYDADRIAAFAQQVREIPEEDLADIGKSAFASNITELLMNAFNTSNIVGYAKSAIQQANSL